MKILVPVDGSVQSQLAVQTAAGLARPGAAVYLLTVSESIYLSALAPSLDGEPGRSSIMRIPSTEESQGILKQASHVLRTKGVEAELLHEEGEPASRILDAVDRLGIDLVIMGPQGKGAVQRFLLGSVTERVTRYAPCSVLVVR